MQRQQEQYEKSKATYSKASRGGLKVKEPQQPAAAKATQQSTSSQQRPATQTGTKANASLCYNILTVHRCRCGRAALTGGFDLQILRAPANVCRCRSAQASSCRCSSCGCCCSVQGWTDFWRLFFPSLIPGSKGYFRPPRQSTAGADNTTQAVIACSILGQSCQAAFCCLSLFNST